MVWTPLFEKKLPFLHLISDIIQYNIQLFKQINKCMNMYIPRTGTFVLNGIAFITSSVRLPYIITG